MVSQTALVLSDILWSIFGLCTLGSSYNLCASELLHSASSNFLKYCCCVEIETYHCWRIKIWLNFQGPVSPSFHLVGGAISLSFRTQLCTKLIAKLGLLSFLQILFRFLDALHSISWRAWLTHSHMVSQTASSMSQTLIKCLKTFIKCLKTFIKYLKTFIKCLRHLSNLPYSASSGLLVH